jgi:hypothetical protein
MSTRWTLVRLLPEKSWIVVEDCKPDEYEPPWEAVEVCPVTELEGAYEKGLADSRANAKVILHGEREAVARLTAEVERLHAEKDEAQRQEHMAKAELGRRKVSRG